MKHRLSIKNINKKFYNQKETTEAIKDISFDVDNGEIVGIVGTSGCGKSTLLNIISGLDFPTGGTCIFDTTNPRISYMLQSDALLPWRSILKNATLGLELYKEDNKENILKVKKMLCEYGLKDFLNKKPNSLSGGMRQRVG